MISASTIQLPMLFILAIFSVGIPGFAICGLWAPNFLPIICSYATVYISYECVARALSVAFDDALLGMLSYLNIWFTSFLFAGMVIPETTVIWPFRVFFTILPLKWGIQNVAYLDVIDATYSGAYPCDPAVRTDCLMAPGDSIGWTCTQTPGGNFNPLLCFGRTGKQVLYSLSANVGAVSIDDNIGRNFGIILAIAVFFLTFYTILASLKASKVSSIKDTMPEAKVIEITTSQ